MFERKVNRIIGLGVTLTLVSALEFLPITALAQQNSDSSSSGNTTNLGTLVVAPQNAPNKASTQQPNLRVQRHSLNLNLGQAIAPQPPSAGINTPSPQRQQQTVQRTQPTPLQIVQPQYPAIAFRSRLKGTVTVGFTINASGSTSNIHIIESNPPGIFDQAARAAVKQWLFQPATVNNQPVAENVRQTLVFRPPAHSGQAPTQTASASNSVSHSGEPPADSVPDNIHPVHLVPPQYPSNAYRRNQGGRVTVSFFVDPNGHTSHIDVLYSKPRHIFDSAARDAVRRWRFKPVGKPTKVVQTITFVPPN